MPPIQRIAVIGAGAWGTALAKHLAEKGLSIMLWAYEREVLDSVGSKRENQLFLPGVTLPPTYLRCLFSVQGPLTPAGSRLACG